MSQRVLESFVANTDGIIGTYTERKVKPLDPDPETIAVEDIAHALGNSCRFTGHVKKFYSVAQHCVHVAELVPDEIKLEALFHDASEAYLSDIARPIKQMPRFGDMYKEYEERLEEAIAIKFGLAHPWDKKIMDADRTMLRAEWNTLMFGKLDDEPDDYQGKIIPWAPVEAKAQFLWAYNRYRR